MQKPAGFALAIIALHAAVVFVHGKAHAHLGIGLAHWQYTYVMAVIVVAPLLAGILLLARQAGAGGIALAVSMTGALLFGAYYHFVAGGADNVASVAASGWGAVFRWTSVLLALTETVGVWASVRVLRARSRTTAAHP